MASRAGYWGLAKLATKVGVAGLIPWELARLGNGVGVAGLNTVGDLPGWIPEWG